MAVLDSLYRGCQFEPVKEDLPMKSQAIIVALFFVSLWSSASIAQNELSPEERLKAEAKMNRMKEAFQKQDVDVSFFGKVLDDHDAPVEGARINANIMHFDPDPQKLFGESKTIELISDANGFYSIEHEKGRSFYITSISKEGYDGSMLKEERGFNYSGPGYDEHGTLKPFVANKKFPVVFRIRKQGEISFLLYKTDWVCQISARESGAERGYDFIRDMPVRDLAKPFFDGEPLASDLLMRATLNAEDAKWTVVLSSGTAGGGIIVSDQLLYEAPETGYQSQYIFMPEGRKPLAAKYIYLRSRNPTIYSRLEIEYCTVDKNFVRLRGRIVTNPYGERNLEQPIDLPYEVRKQLFDKVTTAFRHNGRPSKPDIPKPIKEAKEKAEKDKGNR
jgi:hypothetical protein